jgi:hypothetical protein
VSEHVTFRDVLANRTGLSRASLAEYGSSLDWDAADIAAPDYPVDGSVREVPPMPLSNLVGPAGKRHRQGYLVRLVR